MESYENFSLTSNAKERLIIMNILFRIAFRNLLKHRSRTLFLGGAITGIAFLMTILISLVSGIKQTMIQNGTALMTGHINIAGFYKISPSSASPLITDYKKLFEIAQKEIPEATIIIDRMKAYGKIISESDSIQVPIWGADMQQEQNILGKLDLAEPSEYNSNGEKGNLQDLQQRKTIVIFASQAKKLKVQVGDMLTVSVPTYRNMSNTLDVKLVGVLKDLGLMSQFSTFMNTDDTKEIYQITPTTSGQVMIFLKDINLVPEIEDRLRKKIADAGYTLMDKDSQPFFMKFDRVSGESWTGQRVDITTWEDETSFLKWILQLLSALTYGLTFILLVIVVIGLMNTLWMSIRERTSEIGTLRAIGLQKSKVFIMFLIEATILSIVSIGLGSILGGVLAVGLNWLQIPIQSEALKLFLMSNTLTFQIGFGELFSVFIIMIIFLLTGSLVPIWQATKLKPVIAMQS